MARAEKKDAEKVIGQLLKVRAKEVGYYGNVRRRPSNVKGQADVFTLQDRTITVEKDGKKQKVLWTAAEQFSPRWMAPIGWKPKDYQEEDEEKVEPAVDAAQETNGSSVI